MELSVLSKETFSRIFWFCFASRKLICNNLRNTFLRDIDIGSANIIWYYMQEGTQEKKMHSDKPLWSSQVYSFSVLENNRSLKKTCFGVLDKGQR